MTTRPLDDVVVTGVGVRGPADDLLLRTYAPLVWLHPDETSLPASVEWMLARTRLVDGEGHVVLDRVGSVARLMEVHSAEDSSLELIKATDRGGMGALAPMYATAREVTQGGITVGHDLMYWFFYPFNGNIFDIAKAKAVLGAAIASGCVAGWLFPPYGYLIMAAAVTALAYLGGIDGVQMHESDWEHVTVRVDTQGTILGVYFSAHDGGQWAYQPLPPGSRSRNGYQVKGKRPVVYSALQSHASYSFAGTIERFGGFASDYAAAGSLWDPLDSATRVNPMGRLVNLGRDVLSPPVGCEWIQYTGMWGKRGGGGGVYVEWFGSDLQEYADGKCGPAQRDTWVIGDPGGPQTWGSSWVQLPVEPAAGTALAVAQFRGFLCAVYAQPGAGGPAACAVYNGYRWTQPSVPGLSHLGEDATVCMREFQQGLHTFIRVATDLEWAKLVLDDEGATQGWCYEPLPESLARATGAMAAATFEDALYLMLDRDGHLVMLCFDGTDWTDLTPRYPILTTDAWSVDGPIALAGYAGTLYLSFARRGEIRQGEFTRSKGWVDATPAPPTRAAGAGLAMSSFGGYLYMVYSDPHGQMRWTRRTGTTPWRVGDDGRDFPISGQVAGGGVAAAVFPTKGFLAVIYPSIVAPVGSLRMTDMFSS